MPDNLFTKETISVALDDSAVTQQFFTVSFDGTQMNLAHDIALQ